LGYEKVTFRQEVALRKTPFCGARTLLLNLLGLRVVKEVSHEIRSHDSGRSNAARQRRSFLGTVSVSSLWWIALSANADVAAPLPASRLWRLPSPWLRRLSASGTGARRPG